jgi:hypothetical protein
VAIDPNIPLGVKAPQPIDLMGAQAKALQIGGMRQEAEQRNLQLQQTQRAMQEQDQLKALFSDSSISDPDTLVQRVSAINPQYGQTLRKSMVEAQKDKLDIYGKQVEIVGKTAGSLLHPQTTAGPDGMPVTTMTVDDTEYHNALADLMGRGILDHQTGLALLSLPPGQARVEAVQQYEQKALTAKEQIDQQRKAIEQPLQDAKTVAETDAAKTLAQQRTDQHSAQFKEYRDYANEEVKAGRTPVSFSAYQDMDANRKRPVTAISPTGQTDVQQAVAGMREGTIPPILPGRATKEYVGMLAESRRQGYDLARAATDWAATQKHLATMNGAQQLRLNQAINSLPEMLDIVDGLAQKWKGGQFPILNRANLALAKNGAYGKDVAAVANQLDAEIADVVADLGNVYMGGNSPTEQALQLASKSLKGEWDGAVLRNMVKLAKTNVTIRRNSINATGVAGASSDNPYGFQQPQQAGPGGGATSGGVADGAPVVFPDGTTGHWDAKFSRAVKDAVKK